MISALLISLQGPFRSWGCFSAGDDRGSEMYPTSSAILGMAAACMGVDYHDMKQTSAWYGGFDVITLTALTYDERRGDGSVSKRASELLNDYQTVMHSLGMDNKIRKDVVVSRREYITDGLDVAAITPRHDEAEQWLVDLVHAFQQPAYTPYLGRRSNVFSAPVLDDGEGVRKYQTYLDVADALCSRIAGQQIGNLLPNDCLLRIPGKWAGEMDVPDSEWHAGIEQFIPDERSGALRFFQQRSVAEFYKKIKERDQ